MSADSSKRQSKQGISGQVVLPQPVNDPSIIDSVAGFIHEVVPQACSSVLSAASGSEVSKESIVWAKFHTSDYNDPGNFLADTECQSDSVPPLLIVLGYGSGVQVWGVSGGGEGRELLSYPQGNVRCLQVLYSPQVHPSKDPLASKRPLISIIDNTGPGPQFQTLNFISIRTAEVVKSIKFKTAICDVVCNRKSIVVTFAEKIAIFDVMTLEDRMTVTTCFPSPGINPNPVALGPRWLAYCDKKLTTWQRSSGGCEDEGAQSYTATVIHAAKSLGKGLRDLSGSLTGTVPQLPTSSSQPGIVTVIDIETPRTTKSQAGEDDQTNPGNMVAHFVGHTGPIVAMTFDPSGLLLVVADKHGHRFNVFRLHPHPSSPALAAVHHLYILHRGDTTARVQDVTVSWDSRWVAVSSLRGTTHVFPITPYGGPVAVRTHTTPHVVNRLSRFERSAGLSDGRGSPEGAASVLGGSPRLPPYPHPVVLTPLTQIRRTPTGVEGGDTAPPPVLRLAAKFAPPRALLPPRATPPRTPRHQPKPRVADSLFIISSYGSLVQYDIEPRSPANVPKDKISYDTGIEVSVEAKGEWVLLRPPCLSSVQPPLAHGNPLLPPAPAAPTHSSRLVETHSPQLHHPAKGQDDRWLSQVEIITHTGPHRRLWMGPQFSFKSLDQSNSAEGNQPEPENVPPRSNPVNMPRRPYLWIESSSGGSVDAPYMTDNSEDDSIHGETRLREDLADAMMDTALHASGGVVEGGEEHLTCGMEGVDRAVERRITQFGLVVPISPMVLPEVRVPVLAPDVTARFVVAATQDLTATVVGLAVDSTVGVLCTTEGSSLATEETIVACSSSLQKETEPDSSEVYIATVEPTAKQPLPRSVDAQTETSPNEFFSRTMSDKSLNTSIIFDIAPLSSPVIQFSDAKGKEAEKLESSPSSITEKSYSTNSSSENGSGQEFLLQKPEKSGKKSRKKKNEAKDRAKKVEESFPSLLVVPPCSNITRDIDTSQTLTSISVSEGEISKTIEKEVKDIKKSLVELNQEINIPYGSVILTECEYVPQKTVSEELLTQLIIESPREEADLIVLTANDDLEDFPEESELAADDISTTVIQVSDDKNTSPSVKLDERKEGINVEIDLAEPLRNELSLDLEVPLEVVDLTDVHQVTQSDSISVTSVSCFPKKENGKGRKKKKSVDNIKAVQSRDVIKVSDKNVLGDTSEAYAELLAGAIQNEPVLIQLEDTQKVWKEDLPCVKENTLITQLSLSEKNDGASANVLIKPDTSSDDDKFLSKDSDKLKTLCSPESTESSGKEFQTPSSKKKGKSGKKNKPPVPVKEKVTELSTVVSLVEIKHEVVKDKIGVGESDVDKGLTEDVEGKKVEIEPIKGEQEMEKVSDEGPRILVKNDSVAEFPSDSVSTVEETSDQVSTREETSDNINKSDSEFFIPFVEKRKKKRKNVKEKEPTLKVDVKKGDDVSVKKPDSDSGKMEEGGGIEVRRSRRESRSKAKSPSPSPKGDIAVDSESSDEAILVEVKPQTPKQPKRKKPSKRSDTSETREVEKTEPKSKSEGASDIDYETCSEKKSDSSVESFFEKNFRTIDPFSKSWSGPAAVEEKSYIIDDRDSVYESCNDDEYLSLVPAVATIEPVPEPIPLESSSSMTEDKTDSGDKDIPGPSQTSTKKHKKQKKKKR